MPWIILIIAVWIASKIAQKVKYAVSRKRAQKAATEIERLKIERDTLKARAAAEKKAAADAEKRRKAEAAQAAARTTKEYYTPVRASLVKELHTLSNDPPPGKSQEQIERRKAAISEKIYQIDRKLEKAEFAIY